LNATSLIGRQVVRNLLDRGAPLRVVARDPSRLPADLRDRLDVVPGSHADADVVAQAFAGADAVFWLVPPDPRADSPAAAYLDFSRPAGDAVTRHGVRRMVGVSALGRGSAVAGRAGLVTASLAMDDLIAGTGVSYRALTMPSFMDNALRQVEVIKSRGMFLAPVPGDRAFPVCATRDIAAVATGLLLDDSWSGQGSVPVLGPEDLSYDDLARIMSEVLARPIRFQRIGDEDYRADLLGRGMSAPMAQGMLDMWRAKADGLDNAEPRTPQATTPTTFRRWCEDVLRPAVRS
jgi:uncharacterized protein YbjT (DUF2867 family)